MPSQKRVANIPEFGARLLKARRAIDGMTQKKLACLSGCSRDSIKHYEASRYVPDTANLVSLCKVLNVSADWLLCLSDEMRINLDSNLIVINKTCSVGPSKLLQLSGSKDFEPRSQFYEKA